MGSTEAFEEPTMTKIHQTQYEEDEEEDDEVGDLERKTSSFRREKRTVSTDSSTITVTTSGSSSSSSSSDGTESFYADEPNGKELGVDQSNAAEADSSETLELPEQDKDLGFHGEHNDEKSGSVYFDGEEGIWKCRHCDWTYREGSVLYFESKGSEANGAADAVTDAPESHTDDNLNGEKNQSGTENGSTIKDDVQSGEIEEIEVRDSPEDPKALHQLNAADVIDEEVDIEGDDYGVEKVLENQETHDLYCPYCNSCITKRVVLKKRKRKIRHVLGDSKRERLDIRVGEPTGSSSGDHAQATDHVPRATNPEKQSEEGPYLFLFRCLSCFGLFSPREKIPGDRTELETPLISQPTTTVKPSWFFSIFGSNDKETAGGKGGAQATAAQVNPQGKLDSATETTPVAAAKDPSEAQDGVQGGATTSIPGGATDNGSQVNPLPSSDKNGTPSNANDQLKTEVPVQHVETTFTQDDKRVDTESHDSSKPVVKEGETTIDGLGFLASLAGKDNNFSNGNKPSDKVSLSPIQPNYNMEVLDKVTARPDEVKTDPELPKIVGSEPYSSSILKPDSAPINGTGEKLEIITDHIGTKPSVSPPDSLPTTSLLPSRTETVTKVTPSVEVGEGRKLEILKSIVYGGLIESITSLGVISSAAGSGASTLNILVLGLANLVGGLILIVHKLQELREENPRSTATNVNEQEEDRYKRLLGRRENFRLHATVAILTFIIVGLIPPVVYGFSFRKSDNRDYKAISVLAASLVCIVLLAIAKAHVKTPRDSYLKSVLYYTTIAISASGVSYFVGDIVSQWLEKYGWSDGSENPAELMLPLLGRKAGFGYSSY